MADVFISYHEQSAGKLAAQIADALESAGISCWYAKRDIPPGGDFVRHIPPQIDACKVFLLILNDSIVHQSRHMENELGLAFGRLNNGEEVTILPLEIGDFKRESWIRYYLVHTQSIRIPTLDEQHMKSLIEHIKRLPSIIEATCKRRELDEKSRQRLNEGAIVLAQPIDKDKISQKVNEPADKLWKGSLQ